jgi:hypothetical protein
MESARYAAEVIIGAYAGATGAAAPGALPPSFDQALSGYAGIIRGQWGSHFTLGSIFAGLIGRPAVMKLALRTGMPVPVLMRFVVRMLANLTDHGGRGFEDRVIHLLERLTPAATNQTGSVAAAGKEPAPTIS